MLSGCLEFRTKRRKKKVRIADKQANKGQSVARICEKIRTLPYAIDFRFSTQGKYGKISPDFATETPYKISPNFSQGTKNGILKFANH
jgi:hypothetical protein